MGGKVKNMASITLTSKLVTCLKKIMRTVQVGMQDNDSCMFSKNRKKGTTVSLVNIIEAACEISLKNRVYYWNLFSNNLHLKCLKMLLTVHKKN